MFSGCCHSGASDAGTARSASSSDDLVSLGAHRPAHGKKECKWRVLWMRERRITSATCASSARHSFPSAASISNSSSSRALSPHSERKNVPLRRDSRGSFAFHRCVRGGGGILVFPMVVFFRARVRALYLRLSCGPLPCGALLSRRREQRLGAAGSSSGSGTAGASLPMFLSCSVDSFFPRRVCPRFPLIVFARIRRGGVVCLRSSALTPSSVRRRLFWTVSHAGGGANSYRAE